jgi:hypothetical protein
VRRVVLCNNRMAAGVRTQSSTGGLLLLTDSKAVTHRPAGLLHPPACLTIKLHNVATQGYTDACAVWVWNPKPPLQSSMCWIRTGSGRLLLLLLLSYPLDGTASGSDGQVASDGEWEQLMMS